MSGSNLEPQGIASPLEVDQKTQLKVPNVFDNDTMDRQKLLRTFEPLSKWNHSGMASESQVGNLEVKEEKIELKQEHRGAKQKVQGVPHENYERKQKDLKVNAKDPEEKQKDPKVTQAQEDSVAKLENPEVKGKDLKIKKEALQLYRRNVEQKRADWHA